MHTNRIANRLRITATRRPIAIADRDVELANIDYGCGECLLRLFGPNHPIGECGKKTANAAAIVLSEVNIPIRDWGWNPGD